jgi:hypothetical protein
MGLENLKDETKVKIDAEEQKFNAIVNMGSKPEEVEKAQEKLVRIQEMKADAALDDVKAEAILAEITGEVSPTSDKKSTKPEEELPFMEKLNAAKGMVGKVKVIIDEIMKTFEGLKDSLLAMGAGQLGEFAGLIASIAPGLSRFLGEIARSEKGMLIEAMQREKFSIVPDSDKQKDRDAWHTIYNEYATVLVTPERKKAIAARKDAAALAAFNAAPKPAVAPGVTQPTAPTPINPDTITVEEMKADYNFKTFMSDTILSANLPYKTVREQWRLRPKVNGGAPVSMTEISEMFKAAPAAVSTPTPAPAPTPTPAPTAPTAPPAPPLPE